MYVVYLDSASSTPRVLLETVTLLEMVHKLKRAHWIDSWFKIFQENGNSVAERTLTRRHVCTINSNKGKLKWFFPELKTPAQNTLMKNISYENSLDARAFNWRLTPR